jgi:hypothetical protein
VVETVFQLNIPLLEFVVFESTARLLFLSVLLAMLVFGLQQIF